MPLPTPNRNLPDTLDTGPPGPTGANYADEVASEVERLWDLVPNPLVNVGGSANAITAECDPPLIKHITHGQPFWLVPAANCGPGGVNIDIDGRGAVDIVAYDGSALVEDDLVAGQGVLFFGYVAGSPATTVLRLPGPTTRQLLLLSQAVAPISEQIGDSGNLGTVAQVEFTFVAGRYAKILVVISELAGASSSGIVAALRHSGGAIVTLTGENVIAGAEGTYLAEFAIGLVGGTRQHFGRMDGQVNGTPDASGPYRVGGSNATAPDRVRVARSSGNITTGRVMVYGVLATAP